MIKQLGYLKQVTPTQKDLKKEFFTLDIETYGLSPRPKNFAVCVIYGYNFKKVLYTTQAVKQELLHERYKNKTVFGHNIEYDLSGIFGNIIKNIDKKAVFNGGFITCKYNKVRFADSFNIYPASLKKIGIATNQDFKGVTPEKFIKAQHHLPVTDKDVEYCVQDCKVLYNALLIFFNKIGSIKLTVASASMYFFRSKYLKRDYIYNNTLNQKFFDSYFGGRTEVFKIGKVDARSYDLNSLYPSIMQTIKLPDFTSLKTLNNPTLEKTMRLIKYKEGLVYCKIKHKHTAVGYLPYRNKENNKLLFPVGIFSGCWNFNELRYAIDNGVVEILDVTKVIFSNPTDGLMFKDFVSDLYNERKNTTNELNKYILKLLLNSLYGRWGMRLKFQNEYFNEIPFTEINKLKESKEYYKLQLFDDDREDCFLETRNKSLEFSYFAIPLIASYITSGARLVLLEGILKNINSLVYCDTDSLFLESKQQGLSMGNNLLQYKDEGKNIINIKGLKNYEYIDENGEKKHTIKGVSKYAKKIDKNTYKINTYYKTLESIRRQKITGLNYDQTKIIKNIYDKRIVAKNGTTKPIILNEN